MFIGLLKINFPERCNLCVNPLLAPCMHQHHLHDLYGTLAILGVNTKACNQIIARTFTPKTVIVTNDIR